MRKKEAWMNCGVKVLANGKVGRIVHMQENRLDNIEKGVFIDYVYYIEVRLAGQSHTGTYHPNDIEPYIEKNQEA